jgi:hypothetical protein
MKNLTIALDDETYRRARIRAAEQGTSVSAMVKRFLTEGDQQPTGVHETPTPFTPFAPSAAPASAVDPDLPPGAYGRFPDGTPYYTKDGKPRKPGAMRHLYGSYDPETFEGWPDGFIDAMYGEDTEAARNWWKPFAVPPPWPPEAS